MLRNVFKLPSVSLQLNKFLKASPLAFSGHTPVAHLQQQRFYTSNNGRDTPQDDIRFVYIQNPMRWLRARLEILKLQMTWDPKFKTDEFLRGSTQAVVMFTQCIKDSNVDTIKDVTTEKGFHNITRDMFYSRNDPRVKLISFRTKDIKRTVPHRVHFRKTKQGKKLCFVDVFAVGLRGVQDIEDAERPVFMLNLRRLAQMDKKNNWMNHTADAYILAEVFTRFQRDYGIQATEQWLVDFYKVTSFSIILVKPNMQQ